jgi:hypothetical protein
VRGRRVSPKRGVAEHYLWRGTITQESSRYRTMISSIPHIQSTDEISMPCSVQTRHVHGNIHKRPHISIGASRKLFHLQPRRPIVMQRACCMQHDDCGKGIIVTFPAVYARFLRALRAGRMQCFLESHSGGTSMPPQTWGGGSQRGSRIVCPGCLSLPPIGFRALRELFFSEELGQWGVSDSLKIQGRDPLR